MIKILSWVPLVGLMVYPFRIFSEEGINPGDAILNGAYHGLVTFAPIYLLLKLL